MFAAYKDKSYKREIKVINGLVSVTISCQISNLKVSTKEPFGGWVDDGFGLYSINFFSL